MPHPLPAPAPATAPARSAPRCRLWLAATALAFALSGCAAWRADDAARPVAQRLQALGPADVLLLGEQHDATEHQDLQRQSVEALAARGQLAALALEMAESGHDTARLPADASEAQVRSALAWNEKVWPWAPYAPVVMRAVRAGVPVLGANLPRARMKAAMADVSLDVQLKPEAIAAQRQAVREGHCDLLPAAQIEPMTRVQIARDREMARTAARAVQPGRTVLLVAGSAHADKALGVPQHLPTELRVRSVAMVAGEGERSAYDAVWRTPALERKDHCEALKASLPAG